MNVLIGGLLGCNIVKCKYFFSDIADKDTFVHASIFNQKRLWEKVIHALSYDFQPLLHWDKSHVFLSQNSFPMVLSLLFIFI